LEGELLETKSKMHLLDDEGRILKFSDLSIEDQLSYAEEGRVHQFIERIARNVLRKISHGDKAEMMNHWQYEKIQRYFVEEFNAVLKREARTILKVSLQKPSVFNFIEREKKCRATSRKNMATQLRNARKRLVSLWTIIKNAEAEAQKIIAHHIEKKSMMEEGISTSQYPYPPFGYLVPTDKGEGLPQKSGIYFIWLNEEIRYVGLSVSLSNRCRLNGHHILKNTDRISYLLFARHELKWAESFYIGTLRPVANFGGIKNGTEHRTENDEKPRGNFSPGDFL